MQKYILAFSVTALCAVFILGSIHVLSARSAAPSYDALWDEAAAYIKKRQPRSALSVLDSLEEKALKEHNTPQYVRALIAKMQQQNSIDNDHAPRHIAEHIRLADQSARHPECELLHAVVADELIAYHNAYRWRNRTRTTVDTLPSDIAEWSSSQIISEAYRHLRLSLRLPDDCVNLPIDDFAPLITAEVPNTPPQSHTLLYFLTRHTVQLLSGLEGDFSAVAPSGSPIGVASVEDLFCPTDTFLNLHLSDANSMDSIPSPQLFALSAFQRLIAATPSPSDLRYLSDLSRLSYAHDLIHRCISSPTSEVALQADSLYLSALHRLNSQYAASEISVEGMVTELQLRVEQAARLSSPSERDAVKEQCLDIATATIEHFPHYSRINLLESFCQSLLQSSINVSIERTMANNTLSPVRIRYTNLREATLRIYRVPMDIRAYRTFRENYRNSNRPSPDRDLVLTQTIKLSTAHPFEPADTTVTLRLQFGIYEYVVSGESFRPYKDASFRPQDDGSYFCVSDFALCLLRSDLSDGRVDLLNLDRTTGHPRPDAAISVYTRASRGDAFHFCSTLSSSSPSHTTSDSRGTTFFYFPESGEDRFYFGEEAWLRHLSRDVSKNLRESVSVFTDRSVYRLGQKVQFKSIHYLYGEELNVCKTVDCGKSIELSLYNGEGKEVQRLVTTTNDMGSCDGAFLLPKEELPGWYSIRINGDLCKTIRVEEYKRPSIEIELLNIDHPYAYGDTIRVKGTLNNYSGTAIQGSQIRYNVSGKHSSFQYWQRWQPMGKNILQEGTTESDENGNFTIQIPTQVYHELFYPYQGVQVEVETTDSKGESCETSKYIQIGQERLHIDFYPTDRLERKNITDIKVDVRNSDGNAIREGLNLSYEINRLSRQQTPLDKQSDTGQEETQDLKLTPISKGTLHDGVFKKEYLTPLASGRYQIVITAKGETDETATTKKIVEIYATTDKNTPDNYVLFSEISDTEVEEGGKFNLLLGTDEEKLYVYLRLHANNQVVDNQWVELQKGMKTIEYSFLPQYGTNITLEVMALRNGEMQQKQYFVTKKETPKRLIADLSTLRDVMEAGGTEHWSIKLRHEDGTPATDAEILATLYDASLDEIEPHSWYFAPITCAKTQTVFPHFQSNGLGRWSYASIWSQGKALPIPRQRDEQFYYNGSDLLGIRQTGIMYRAALGAAAPNLNAKMTTSMAVSEVYDTAESAEEEVAMATDDAMLDENGSETPGKENIKIRENFAETAFFYPYLSCDSVGDVQIQFDVPESLTRWKFLLLAHTKDLRVGTAQTTLVTQKRFSISCGFPRFLTEDDQVDLTARIENLSEEPVLGTAELDLIDPQTGKIIKTLRTPFEVTEKNETQVKWHFDVPGEMSHLTLRAVAIGDNASDGEQKVLEVLQRKTPLIETKPITLRGKGEHVIQFDDFIKKQGDPNYKSISYTLEYMNNPAWYAVMALPEAGRPTDENVISLAAAFYVNRYGEEIARNVDGFREKLAQWTKEDRQSPLQKNEELKIVGLSQTTWDLDAENETAARMRLERFFDIDTTQIQCAAYIKKLKKLQFGNGGFAWFDGMPENRYATAFVVEYLLRLHRVAPLEKDILKIAEDGMSYLRECQNDDYEWIRSHHKNYLKENHLGDFNVYVLYLETLTEHPQFKQVSHQYFLEQLKKYHTDCTLYGQARSALVFWGTGEKRLAQELVKSLRERSTLHEELGRYWANNTSSFRWSQRPIETHCAIIETLQEIDPQEEELNDLKTWLINQQRVGNWGNALATLSAIHTLLNGDGKMTLDDSAFEISFGEQENIIDVNTDETQTPGVDYLKVTYNAPDIKPEMGTIRIKKETDQISFGGVYYKVWTNKDKVGSQKNPYIDIEKSLMKVDEHGKTTTLRSSETIHVGDKIRVRVVVHALEDLSFVALVDKFASTCEPQDRLSGYRWSGTSGYYQAIHDESMRFYFDRLPKGTHVFEYTLRATMAGRYISPEGEIQCLYAPEFSAHTAGGILVVK